MRTFKTKIFVRSQPIKFWFFQLCKVLFNSHPKFFLRFHISSWMVPDILLLDDFPLLLHIISSPRWNIIILVTILINQLPSSFLSRFYARIFLLLRKDSFFCYFFLANIFNILNTIENLLLHVKLLANNYDHTGPYIWTILFIH